MESIEVYIVRDANGMYLQSKAKWTNDLKKARVYTKKRPACGQITWWANRLGHGIPDLIPLTATLGEPIPQENRIKETAKKKEILRAKHLVAGAAYYYKKALKNAQNSDSQQFKDELEDAETVLRRREREYEELKNS